jgi:hypothetical protein
MTAQNTNTILHGLPFTAIPAQSNYAENGKKLKRQV